ncbi:MAG: hypothetical protein JRG82_01820 [Deltaproteobacteria bacterium]|nr:hypothetical protein [Deltaproteobacteria bacterium]
MKSMQPRAPGWRARLLCAWLAAWGLSGCTLPGSGADPAPGGAGSPTEAARSAEFEVRGQRVARLEEDLERLRADLRHAEEALVSLGSPGGAQQGRTDAVSAIAHARSRIELAAQVGGDSAQMLPEARRSLLEAERQLHGGRHQTASYFAARARRMA